MRWLHYVFPVTHLLGRKEGKETSGGSKELIPSSSSVTRITLVAGIIANVVIWLFIAHEAYGSAPYAGANSTEARVIYVMNADDGSDVTRLTTDGTSPSWSPDGEKIAFTSFRDADDESEFNAIYTMNADDGSDVTRLTDPNADYSELDWGTNTSSADGKDNKDKKHDHKDKKHDR